MTWPVVIRCPRGKAYTTTALLSERDPAAVPEMLGDDVGIDARPAEERSGRCTGVPQVLVLRLVTQPVHFYHFPSDAWIDGHYPIHPSTKTNAQLTLTGSGFSTFYCAAPACAEETGPRVILKSSVPAPSEADGAREHVGEGVLGGTEGRGVDAE